MTVLGFIAALALAAWLGVVLVVVGVCRAAARGDAKLVARRHFRRPLRVRGPTNCGTSPALARRRPA
jgi:hypothetical protein